MEELLKIINQEIISKLPEEEKEKFDKHRNAFLELLRKRTDYEEIEERYKELEEMEVPKMFDTLEEIAKRDREKARLEERKEFEIRLLSKRFGNQLTEDLKDKIRKADEKTIDYIGDNLLEITIEELKELLK